MLHSSTCKSAPHPARPHRSRYRSSRRVSLILFTSVLTIYLSECPVIPTKRISLLTHAHSPRKYSPLPGLTAPDLEQACKCITAAAAPQTVSPKATRAAKPTACVKKDVAILQAEYRDTEAFCKFYTAQTRALSPVPGIDALSLFGACRCALSSATSTRHSTATTTIRRTSTSPTQAPVRSSTSRKASLSGALSSVRSTSKRSSFTTSSIRPSSSTSSPSTDRVTSAMSISPLSSSSTTRSTTTAKTCSEFADSAPSPTLINGDFEFKNCRWNYGYYMATATYETTYAQATQALDMVHMSTTSTEVDLSGNRFLGLKSGQEYLVSYYIATAITSMNCTFSVFVDSDQPFTTYWTGDVPFTQESFTFTAKDSFAGMALQAACRNGVSGGPDAHMYLDTIEIMAVNTATSSSSVSSSSFDIGTPSASPSPSTSPSPSPSTSPAPSPSP